MLGYSLGVILPKHTCLYRLRRWRWRTKQLTASQSCQIYPKIYMSLWLEFCKDGLLARDGTSVSISLIWKAIGGATARPFHQQIISVVVCWQQLRIFRVNLAFGAVAPSPPPPLRSFCDWPSIPQNVLKLVWNQYSKIQNRNFNTLQGVKSEKSVTHLSVNYTLIFVLLCNCVFRL